MKSRAAISALALAAGLALGPGCVTASWSRTHRDEKLEPHVLQELSPGHDDLATCLERLGAPLYVLEDPGGAALAWGWLESEGWGFSASLPVYRSASLSLDLEQLDERLEGAVLFFDGDWVLRFARRGKLSELVRRPPAVLEDV